jgi:SAM-dependent methyltransferase
MGNVRYVIRGGVEGRERLRLLSEVMGPSTRDLLAAVGIPGGAACLDAGCGGGDVTLALAGVAGPAGRAIGVDLDDVKIDLARQEAERRGVANVSFEVRDVADWEPGESFDVVYARFLLSHLPEPGRLLAAVRHHLRPGGVIVLEDIDFRGHFSEPECPALERFVELYTKSVQSRGADPNIGPRLPGLLRHAGLSGIQMRLVHPAALEGGIKLLTCVTFENIAEAVVKDGLIQPDELQETIESLWAFARDPHTIVGGPRVFQAWGRNEA